MKPITIEEILKATKGVDLTAFREGTVTNVVVDSRLAREGSLFVALPGEQTDGHCFLEKAVQSGAACALVSRMPEEATLRAAVEKHCPLIRVNNTEQALMDLAEWYLAQFGCLKVAVTGSVGKTSTKEMAARILETRYRTVKTEGNHNNNIGLPLTVFAVDAETEAVVLEMGMDKPGEIHGLAKVVRPDLAIITTIGTSHMEKLGSREAICEEKCSVTDYMDASCTLIINDTNDLLHSRFYGTAKETNETYHLVRVAETDGTLLLQNAQEDADGISFTLDGTAFRLPLAGRHNAMNASLAAAAGLIAGISLEESAQALADFSETTGSRLKRIETEKYVILDDSYNASPESMKAAIDTLAVLGTGRKVAILGDMYELGSTEKALHGMVGNYAARMQVDLLLAVGQNAKYMAAEFVQETKNGQCKYYETKEECVSELPETLQTGDTILLKASRGMALETILKEILNQ